jgi:hypothetical protein
MRLLTSRSGPRDLTARIEGLWAVSELRGGLDRLEADYVAEEMRSRLRWSRIADALGVTKQATHKRHARRPKREQSVMSSNGRARTPVTMLSAGARRDGRPTRSLCGTLIDRCVREKCVYALALSGSAQAECELLGIPSTQCWPWPGSS